MSCCHTYSMYVCMYVCVLLSCPQPQDAPQTGAVDDGDDEDCKYTYIHTYLSYMYSHIPLPSSVPPYASLPISLTLFVDDDPSIPTYSVELDDGSLSLDDTGAAPSLPTASSLPSEPSSREDSSPPPSSGRTHREEEHRDGSRF